MILVSCRRSTDLKLLICSLISLAFREYSLMAARIKLWHKCLASTTSTTEKTITEEHISISVETGSTYFSHPTLPSGSSKDISQSLVTSLREQNAKTENIKPVGCAGTIVNTGHTAGVIRWLEESFGHPLQWLVCLLHTNDLPLRHLSQALDGATTGPRGFSIKKRMWRVENNLSPRLNQCSSPNNCPKWTRRSWEHISNICSKCAISLANVNVASIWQCKTLSAWITHDG